MRTRSGRPQTPGSRPCPNHCVSATLLLAGWNYGRSLGASHSEHGGSACGSRGQEEARMRLSPTSPTGGGPEVRACPLRKVHCALRNAGTTSRLAPAPFSNAAAASPPALLSATGPLGHSYSHTHSSSKIAIMRCARGLVAIWGIWRNSSLSMDPEPSLSSFMKRFLRRRSSGAETAGGSAKCEET